MRGKIVVLGPTQELSDAEVVIRAFTQVGRPVMYHLSYPNGGTDPSATGPEDKETIQADCIGFATWAKGFDRFQPPLSGGKPRFPLYDGYVNTDSMILEAKSPGDKHWFSILDRPVPGCFVVGSSFWRKLPIPRKITGHIGVVVDVTEWDTKKFDGIHVVHCSPYNYQFTANKSAIWKISGRLWTSYPDVCFVQFNREYAMSLT